VINNKTEMTGRASVACSLSSALLCGAMVVVLTSCATGQSVDVPPPSSTQNPLPAPPQPAPAPSETAAVGTVSPVQTNDALAGSPVDAPPITRESIRDPRHPLARRIVFFDYNSSQLDEESIELLTLHAQYLSNFRDVRVRLEGHTDERGSREYNIALGDNRSKAVARILNLQGVDAGQFSTLSYGEEVPLDEGNSESSYRRNRRVELVYEGLS
jgi:peptidoglycan-associated lipoprotein